MRIQTLKIEQFGPFLDYQVEFSQEENICLLLTGKNNEGKSTIINCLRLLSNATRVVWKKKQEISINGEISAHRRRHPREGPAKSGSSKSSPCHRQSHPQTGPLSGTRRACGVALLRNSYPDSHRITKVRPAARWLMDDRRHQRFRVAWML